MRLAKRSGPNALRARAAAGLGFAGGYLPGLLTKLGRAAEAERLGRHGLTQMGQLLAGNRRMLRALYVLQRRGRLRRSASSGVPVPAARRNYQG
jgi:hypothetical protein